MKVTSPVCDATLGERRHEERPVEFSSTVSVVHSFLHHCFKFKKVDESALLIDMMIVVVIYGYSNFMCYMMMMLAAPLQMLFGRRTIMMIMMMMLKDPAIKEEEGQQEIEGQRTGDKKRNMTKRTVEGK